MSEELSRAVAEVIKRLCDERGWSQRELARRAGLQQSNLTRKLAGPRRFEVDELLPISDALDVPLDELIRRSLR